MEAFNLHIGLENFLEKLFNSCEEKCGNQEDVREVLCELSKCTVGAVALDIVDVVFWV